MRGEQPHGLHVGEGEDTAAVYGESRHPLGCDRLDPASTRPLDCGAPLRPGRSLRGPSRRLPHLQGQPVAANHFFLFHFLKGIHFIS